MGGYSSFYAGADYGFDPSGPNGATYNDFSGYSNVSVGEIGFTHDPRTSNLLKSVSDKLNTGAKVVEVQGIQMDQLDYVPKQQWKELARLRKLTGVDFTFHGPLVEATGVTKQGWDESQRQHAEEEMYSALERAQVMDEKGNLVVTFHASNGLPEVETRQKVTMPNGKTADVITSMMVVDQRTGQFTNVVAPLAKDYFKEGKEAGIPKIEEKLKEQNRESWAKQLQSVSFHASNGNDIIKRTFIERDEFEDPQDDPGKERLLEYYQTYVKNPEQAQKELERLEPKKQKILQRLTDNMVHGDLYLRDAYNDLQKLFNQAYQAAKESGDKKVLGVLDNYRNQASKEIQVVANDPSKVDRFGRLIIDGVNTLRKVEAPEILKPLKDWAIDKSSDTFANVAYRGYKRFKENAPVVSVENPPAGTTGLHRGEDLRQVIEASRKKFIQQAVQDGMSVKKADEEAKKLLGITWDVGHINMIRKFGYDEDDIVEETKRVADMVKHVHLSDNFGLAHTELPMGMGNVPTKRHLELIEKFEDQKNKIKKIVETGGWYQHFQVTPFRETLEAFGSPLYAMQMAPAWGQFAGSQGAPYFAGRGMNPDVHHSIYGAGFSTLPIELGGQMPGGVNRMSGTSLS